MTRSETAPRRVAPTVTPAEMMLDHLRASGGQLAQRQLVTEVGYGTAACRRVLAELETGGLVTRRDVGRDTIVSVTDRDSATNCR